MLGRSAGHVTSTRSTFAASTCNRSPCGSMRVRADHCSATTAVATTTGGSASSMPDPVADRRQRGRDRDHLAGGRHDATRRARHPHDARRHETVEPVGEQRLDAGVPAVRDETPSTSGVIPAPTTARSRTGGPTPTTSSRRAARSASKRSSTPAAACAATRSPIGTHRVRPDRRGRRPTAPRRRARARTAPARTRTRTAASPCTHASSAARGEVEPRGRCSPTAARSAARCVVVVGPHRRPAAQSRGNQ